MKWKNRGHEFDRLGTMFSDDVNIIYLFGAGETGENLFKLLTETFRQIGILPLPVLCFVDTDMHKQLEPFLGVRVISPEQFFSNFGATDLVVITASNQNAIEIKQRLAANSSIRFGENAFMWEDFLAQYMFYKHDLLCLPIAGILVTRRCNLACENCSARIADRKVKKDTELEACFRDIDALFSKFDFIITFSIGGGEPLLNPNLAKVIDYVSENYRNRILTFNTITNGTIVPDNVVLAALQRSGSMVYLDDYRETVPICKEQYPRIIEALERHGIGYKEVKHDYWFDFALESTDNSSMSQDELEEHMQSCVFCYECIDGKLYRCFTVAMAIEPGVIKETSNDFLDLGACSREELLEFMVGFTEKGAYDLCKRCAGVGNMNKCSIHTEAAVQAKH